MDEIQIQKILSNIFKTLIKISPDSYKEVWEQHENSIDFITDGEIKRLIGISYYVDPRVTLKLTPSSVCSKRIQLKLFSRIRMKDFTTGSNENVQLYDLFYYTKFPIDGLNEEIWEHKIQTLHREVQATSYRLKRKYTPSHRLSKIVGKEPKPKYQILDQISEYILSNNLRLSNGSIRVDKDLKPFYSKNTFTVCENLFFETLRENTLIDESQLKLISSIQGKLNGAKKLSRRHLMVNNGTSCGTLKYLEGPIT